MPSGKMPRACAERKESVATVEHDLGATADVHRDVDALLRILAIVELHYSVAEAVAGPLVTAERVEIEARAHESFLELLGAGVDELADSAGALCALDAFGRHRARYPRGGHRKGWVAPFRALWLALGRRPLWLSDDAIRGREHARRRRARALLATVRARREV